MASQDRLSQEGLKLGSNSGTAERVQRMVQFRRHGMLIDVCFITILVHEGNHAVEIASQTASAVYGRFVCGAGLVSLVQWLDLKRTECSRFRAGWKPFNSQVPC